MIVGACREMVIQESGRFSRLDSHRVCRMGHTRLLIKCSPRKSEGAMGGVEGGKCPSVGRRVDMSTGM